MTGRAFRIATVVTVAAAVAVVILIGTVGLSVLAGVGGSGDPQSGLLSRVYHAGMRLHGGGHHESCQDEHDGPCGEMARLIEQLDLTPDQHRHVERIHEIMKAHHGSGSGSMVELHEKLVAQLGRGEEVDRAEIRRVVDEHVAQIRSMAYAVTDELVALANSLDTRQREILQEHLRDYAAPERD
jgi:Spy/CpxP family protein refolding chaperone